jgi:hypothetical protein
VSQASAAHDLEQAILDPRTAPEEALWDRYFSPGASPPVSCADAVVQYAIGYLGFAEALMGADLLAGAGPLGAVLVETGSVLWLETVAEAGVVTSLPELAVSIRTLVEAPVAYTFVADSSGSVHYLALLNRQLLDSLLAASAEPSTLSTANPSRLASGPSVSLEAVYRPCNPASSPPKYRECKRLRDLENKKIKKTKKSSASKIKPCGKKCKKMIKRGQCWGYPYIICRKY